MTKWYQKTPQEVARLLESDLYGGLTERQAHKRSLEKKNTLFERRQSGSSMMAKSFLSALLPLLLLITAVALLLSDEVVSGLVLLGTLALSSFFLWGAYIKARSIIELAERKLTPSCRVIREGRLFLIPSEDLVRGDVILLEKGDFVPADCLLISAEALLMREGGVTARKFASKNAAALFRGENYWEADSVVLAGTCVESGSCRAIVTLLGQDTYFCSLVEQERGGGFEKTPLVASLKKLSAISASVLLGFLFLATLWGFFPMAKGDFLENFILVCAFAASAMTELYAVFAYIAAGSALYGAGASSEGALVRNVAELDRIADLSLLFLTTDYFRYPLSSRLLGLALPLSEGIKASAGEELALNFLLRDGALAFGEWYGAMPLQGASGKEVLHGELADLLRKALRHTVLSSEGADYPLIVSGSTSHGLSYGMILRGDNLIVTLVGEEQEVLPRCAHVYEGGKVRPLTKEDEDGLAAQTAALAKTEPDQSRRVFAVAVGILDDLPPGGVVDDGFFEERLFGNLALEGFFVTEESLHVESLAALPKAREAGLAFGIFCHDEKDASVAEKIGFSPEEIHINKSRREIYDQILCAKAGGETVGFGGGDLAYLAHRQKADVAFSLAGWQNEGEKREVRVDDEDSILTSRLSCDALRLSSDLALSYPRKNSKKGEKAGGFASLFDAILSAKVFRLNMASLVSYLVFVTAMKLFLTVAALVFQEPMLSPLFLVLMGLGFDLLVAFSFLLRRPSVTKGRDSFVLKHFLKSLTLYAASGFLCGAALFVALLVSGVTGHGSELLVTAVILALSLVAFEMEFSSGKAGFRGLPAIVGVGGVILLFFLMLSDTILKTGAWIAVASVLLLFLLLQGVLLPFLQKKLRK